MELKVVLDKKDYDALQKEITDLKELIDTKVITRTDRERQFGGLHGYQTTPWIVLTKTYTGPKDIIDEINDGIIKGDAVKIKELENDIALKNEELHSLAVVVKRLKKQLAEVNDWKKLSLFRRIL
jgi:DNA polymerase sigma